MVIRVDRNIKLWRGGRIQSYRALVIGGELLLIMTPNMAVFHVALHRCSHTSIPRLLYDLQRQSQWLCRIRNGQGSWSSRGCVGGIAKMQAQHLFY